MMVEITIFSVLQLLYLSQMLIEKSLSVLLTVFSNVFLLVKLNPSIGLNSLDEEIVILVSPFSFK